VSRGVAAIAAAVAWHIAPYQRSIA